MSKTVKIKAALDDPASYIIAPPGRVALRFIEFPDGEQQLSSGIFVPSTSVQIPEVAEILDIGDPAESGERTMHGFLLRCQKMGVRVFAEYAAGGWLWRPNLDTAEWGWLKPIRIFRFAQVLGAYSQPLPAMSSPTAHLEIEEASE